jgi:uncharacterized protein involved in exopolysaccharide biosynthesis
MQSVSLTKAGQGRKDLSKQLSTTVSTRDVAGVIFRHKLLICATFLTVVIGTAIVTFMMPNQYESRMKILVKNSRTDVPITPERTNGMNGAPPEAEASETQINSEIALLTSKDLLNQIVIECGLASTQPSTLQRLGLKAAPKTSEGRVEEAADRLSKALVIEPVKKASIIEVTYTSESPQKAAEVLSKLRDLYLDKHVKLHRPPGTFEFFRNQADQYELQLQDAEKQFSDFQRSMNVVSLNQQKEQTVLKVTESRARMLETESSLKEVTGRIDRLQQQLKTVQPRIVTQSRALPNQYSAERLNTMIVELQNKRTQLLTKFRPDDRLVKEIDQQIATTRAALQRATRETAVEQSTDLNPLRQTLESELARARVDEAGARGRYGTLVDQLKQYEGQLARLEGITAQYEDMARKVKQSEESYQLYNKKQEEARIADELDQNKITNVSIAEAPVQSQLPSKPNRPVNLLLGLFLGLLLSAGSVVTVELLRETINTPRELEAFAGVPVLAALPRDRKGARRALIIEKPRLALPRAQIAPEVKVAAGE